MFSDNVFCRVAHMRCAPIFQESMWPSSSIVKIA
jgi:hypothetical protein